MAARKPPEFDHKKRALDKQIKELKQQQRRTEDQREFWKTGAKDFWKSWDWESPGMFGIDNQIALLRQNAERDRYAKLDWAILYALGAGLEQSQLYVSTSDEHDRWSLRAKFWQGRIDPVLCTVETQPFSYRTTLEFSLEFAAELCDQAYGRPGIETVYTTDDDDRILS